MDATTQNLIIIYFIVINVVTFIVYGIDKWLAKHAMWRISEPTLIWLAIAGGSVGALLGMEVWRHKKSHKLFSYGIPMILVAQIAFIWVIRYFL